MNVLPESLTPGKKKTSFRFGLLDLMLVTTVTAIWIPAWMARREIPKLEAEVKTLRKMSSELYIADDQKITIRSFGKIAWDVETWQCYFPPGHQQELHLATENVCSLGYPDQYESVLVPEGRHDIHIVRQDDERNGYRTRVFIDQEQVLDKHHPPSWLPDSDGSSWSGDIGDETKQFDPNALIRIRQMFYTTKHPQNNSSVSPPKGYASKGLLVWLSPTTTRLPPIPTFVHPGFRLDLQRGWGSREGARLCSQSSMGRQGLLEVEASFHATLRRWPPGVQALSVRPVFEDGKLGTPPESQISRLFSSLTGLAVAYSNHVDLAPDRDRFYNHYDPANEITGQISADGRYQSVFAHFEKLIQRDQPIIEFRFDAQHPDRIGILPHQRPGSDKLKACKLLTTLDSRYRFRFAELTSEGSKPESVSVKTIEQDFDTASEGSLEGLKQIPINRLPVLQPDTADDAPQRRVLRLTTDVPNFSKVPMPAGVQQPWHYRGMPVEQSWIIDESSGAELAIRTTTNFPAPPTAASFPGGAAPPGPVPGGPVVGWTELTIPMPAIQPVWLEIRRQETFPAKQ